MAGGRVPALRQVEQAVPENARHPADQQLGGAVDAEDLHFFRSERSHTHLGHPDRLALRNGLDLGDLGRPLVDLPQVPVQREAMHRQRVDRRKDAMRLDLAHPVRIDGRHAAENARDVRIHRGDGVAGADHAIGEQGPFGIEGEIPVRLVVRLVPEHGGFDHGLFFPAGPRAG